MHTVLASVPTGGLPWGVLNVARAAPAVRHPLTVGVPPHDKTEPAPLFPHEHVCHRISITVTRRAPPTLEHFATCCSTVMGKQDS